MNFINKIPLTAFFCLALLLASCSKDNELNDNSPDDFDFSGTYELADQMGRPAINTVFVSSDNKDNFNSTIPTEMSAQFQSSFQSRLVALNPGYTTNALGLDAATFTSILATDVLGVSTTGTTTFFDGTNVLTGRTLADDVIDIELLLIFGGPDGSSNPGLTSDNVDSNDKTFSNVFPYLSSPW